MAEKCYVSISKTDVLTEDFSKIWGLIRDVASDENELLAARNTWEVFFSEYDDDPREIPEIPEVVNWINKSIEDGIPWFYFMRSDPSSVGLLAFMVSVGAERDPEHAGRYFFEEDRIMPFIKKNMDNLADFVEEYDIPTEVGIAATDSIMEFVQNVLQGSEDQGDVSEHLDRNTQIKEALERLTALEELFSLNPNVRKYFEDGRLYYSYLTFGGYAGSIDTIHYNEHYADIVEAFESQTSYLVYHVIERENTLAVLFVSDDTSCWQDERPALAGVMAWVVDLDTSENEIGYIKIDTLQGALYRPDDTVYPSRPDGMGPISDLSDVDGEIVERLEILKNAGLTTDLDISAIYMQEGEICCSLLQVIFGTPVGVVNRISANSTYEQILEHLDGQTSKKLYFLMGSERKKLAFLYVSDDPSDWEMEKLDLEKGTPHAMVVDLQEMTAEIRQIRYEFVRGGPLFISD